MCTAIFEHKTTDHIFAIGETDFHSMMKKMFANGSDNSVAKQSKSKNSCLQWITSKLKQEISKNSTGLKSRL